MSEFVVEVSVLLLAAYVIGCAAGCWLRRVWNRRSQKA